MGQCFCMTNWQKGSLKMKTSVHMKRLSQHFLKRFHHFARSLKELVLKQRLDILAFTTVCPSPVRSCLCLKLSLHWRGMGWSSLLGDLLWSLQWGKVEGLECNFHRKCLNRTVLLSCLVPGIWMRPFLLLQYLSDYRFVWLQGQSCA